MTKWLVAFTLGVLLNSPVYAMLQFLSPVVASPFGDGDNWRLVEKLDYRIYETPSTITLEPGFVTDFASIPRPFWSILPTWGQYGPASIVHDFLYWDQQCSREQADAIFLAAMKESHVKEPWRTIIHFAVRMGGFFSWKSNQRLRSSGKTREVPAGFELPFIGETWDSYQNRIYESGFRPDPRPSSNPKPGYCSELENVLSKSRDNK